MKLGRGFINAQPNPNGGKFNEGKVIDRELVIAGGNAPALLNLVEKPLDQIAAR
jgi:hypothetical protein